MKGVRAQSEWSRRISRFLLRQARDCVDGGPPALLRKGILAIELVLAVPCVLLARLLRPVLLIRFGGLPTGGMASAALLEVYSCEHDAGLHGRRAIDLFCISEPICNVQLTTMWERRLHVNRFVRSLERVNRWLPGGRLNRIPFRRLQVRDIHNLLEGTTPHMLLTPEEARRGETALRQLGVPDGVPFVCFHARDAAYKASVGIDDQHITFRNSDIRSLYAAMDALVRRGYVCLRMGASVEVPLQTAHTRIIDYATTARTEFLDIFLCARCHFFIGDGTGLLCAAMAFRRPTAMINVIPMEYASSWNSYDLFTPKLLWSRRERRLLAFPEIIESKIGRFMRTRLYEEQELEVIDNTPEEITALALEMDERLRGTWQTTDDDEESQQRFRSLYPPSEYHGAFRARVGADFLHQHRELLETRTPNGTVVVSLRGNGR